MLLPLLDLTEKETLALVGDKVSYDFTIPGIANESDVSITWKWNGLDGNVNEQGIQFSCLYFIVRHWYI